jgi:DNA polymerase kappa
MWQNLKK